MKLSRQQQAAWVREARGYMKQTSRDFQLHERSRKREVAMQRARDRKVFSEISWKVA